MLSSTFSKFMLVGVMALAALLVPGILSGQGTVNAAPACDAKPADNASSAGSVSFDDTDVPCVNTVAVVDPADPGNRPTVTNKFELPDMDPIATGMQYTDAAVSACATPQLAACYDVDGQDVPAKNTVDYAHAHDDDPTGPDKNDQMMVRPNLDDKPAKRMIEVWAIAQDPNGPGNIVSVTTTVNDPTNTKKITYNLVKGHCDDLGSPTDVFSPVHAAQNTGQWAHGKACDPKVDTLWKGTFLLNNDQLPGKYTVKVHGNDQKGSGVDLENTFEVLQTLGFKIDFNALNYGVIAPGFRQTIAGDTTVGQTVGVAGPPPSGGVKPTIANTGNAKWCLDVYSTQMAGIVSQKLNPIDNFSASLNHNDVKYAAEVWTGLGSVQSKETAQLDFSIDPPQFMQSDTYEGRTDLRVAKTCAP